MFKEKNVKILSSKRKWKTECIKDNLFSQKQEKAETLREVKKGD